MTLAKYSVNESNTKGRQYKIEESDDRNDFERDYTRILHSEAFRRLQNKTQVFPNHEGDFFRTRLTHSLEVAQLSKTVAKKLNLNEDLCAVLAIGHDLGHPPFGHQGQDKLDELMKDYGGFEHNLQALRLVDKLESPYIDYEGLNLMFETREGLLKHCSRENALLLGDVAARHLKGEQPPLEVTVVDWCDAKAYVHADLEDAYMMGILTPSLLMKAPGYKEAWLRVKAKNPNYTEPTDEAQMSKDRDILHKNEVMVKTIIREMLRFSLQDLIEYSSKMIEKANLQSLDDVRKCKKHLVIYSPDMLEQHKELKRYSRREIYNHPRVLKFRENQDKIIEDLFNAYLKDPSVMSGKGVDTRDSLHRAVADHISGMTDRFAIESHEYLLNNRPDLLVKEEPKKVKKFRA